MTIGWGAVCLDGIVLATDSMRVAWAERGGADVRGEYGDAKIAWCGDRFAFVRSGAFWADAPWGGASFQKDVTLDEVAHHVWTDLLDHRAAVPGADHSSPCHLLIGGGAVGTAPRLLRYDSDASDLQEVPLGSVAVIGNMAFENPETIRPIEPTLTVAVALGMAIDECHAYVRELYQGFGRTRLAEFSGAMGLGGPFPPTAFPFHVVVMTTDAVRRYRVQLPDDITNEDLRAAEEAREAQW